MRVIDIWLQDKGFLTPQIQISCKIFSYTDKNKVEQRLKLSLREISNLNCNGPFHTRDIL